MPDQQPSTSRRHLLVLGAAGLGFGATGGYIAGANPLADDRPSCDPRERLFDTTDWTTPRYDSAGTARAPARSAPSDTLREQWHVEFDAPRIGQPVITTGRVAVATAQSDRQRIVTIDLASGEEVWTERMAKAPSHVGGLVAAGSDVFYQFRAEGAGLDLVALSLRDGDRRWSALTDHHPRSRPVVTEDGHVWTTDRHSSDDESSVIALSADTGVECSSWRIDGSGNGAPLLNEGYVYYGTQAGAVALDRESGTERWRTDDRRYPHVVTDDRMYATADYGWLSAHDIESGTSEWTVESEHYLDGERDPDTPEAMITEDGESVARPNYRDLALADGVLVTRERVYSDHADRITAFDAEHGDELWQRGPTDEWPDPDDRFWYTGPVIAGDSAFVCENRRDGDSHLQRIDITSGEIVDSIEMSDYALDAPAVGREAVVVPRRDGVGCYAAGR